MRGRRRGKDGDDAAPSRAALQEAALAHLARYATSRANLTRVLERRIARWQTARGVDETGEVAAAAAQARGDAQSVVAGLTAMGAVDDAAFAAARARSLARGGKSRRATMAHLTTRGVAADEIATALPDDPARELAAALATARRRRIGPFRRAPVDADGARRELAALARAGFAQDVARAALALDVDAAETVLREAAR